MNRFVQSTFLFLAIALTSNSYAMFSYSPARCGEEGSTGLEQSEAKGRNEWARKCYPQYKTYLQMRPDGGLKTKIEGFPEDRPLYVLIGKVDSEGTVLNVVKAPISRDQPCFEDESVMIIGICVSGCYTTDQVVHFGKDGYLPIGSRNANLAEETTVMNTESTPNQILYRTVKKAGIVSDPVPKSQVILTLRTESGGELRVTTNHPLVDGKGFMREANSFKVGDSLVRADGSLDKVISINSDKIIVRVANVQLKSSDIDDQIVLGQGFLNGSLYYQSLRTSDANRMVLRHLGLLDNVLKL